MPQFELDVIAFASSRSILTEAVYRAVDSLRRRNSQLTCEAALDQVKKETVSGIRRWRDWERESISDQWERHLEDVAEGRATL